jgi:hypothetical protein
MFIHQCGKGLMVAFLGTLDKGLFIVHARFLRRVRQENRRKVSVRLHLHLRQVQVWTIDH